MGSEGLQDKQMCEEKEPKQVTKCQFSGSCWFCPDSCSSMKGAGAHKNRLNRSSNISNDSKIVIYNQYIRYLHLQFEFYNICSMALYVYNSTKN